MIGSVISAQYRRVRDRRTDDKIGNAAITTVNNYRKMSLIDDRGQTDRVITPTHAGLRRCRWHRPRHAARLAALARSWWR